MGDRSENAEYIYGKKQLRQIDSRIRFLSKRLSELIVVDRSPDDTSKVFFGAWVELEDSDGNLFRYRIVGPTNSISKRVLSALILQWQKRCCAKPKVKKLL